MNLAEKQIIELQITGLGSSGEGVGKIEGFTVFAQGGLPGEKVRVRLNKVKKTYAMGRVIRILEASADRIEPRCPVYKSCGGCQLQHLSYQAELNVKRQQVYDALTRIGHFTDLQVEPTLGAESPWYYRNKMQFPVAEEKGKIAIGCFAAASHKVINVENCFIQKEANNTVSRVVKIWLEKYHIPTYDEYQHKGLVRHVMGRVGVHSGEVMVVLVTTKPELPHQTELLETLKKQVTGFKTLIQNINSKATNIILGRENKVLYGTGTITDSIGSLCFHISAQSFFQVNSEQAEKLYSKALQFANLQGKETVVDVYCGTGTITLFLAQKAAKAYGIEIVPSAIADAKQNALDNKVNNAEFILGDAAEELPKLLTSGVRPEVIVLDPPRVGCEAKVLNALAKVEPKRIIYVSCNPATLARDAAILAEQGYSLTKVQPVDMFSRTCHVECVCLMSRVEK